MITKRFQLSVFRALALCLGGVMLAAGARPAVAAEEKATSKVVVRGSNTIGEELAPQLIAEFKKAHAGVAFDTEFKGTAYGIGAVMGGFCDIAAASKAVVPEQTEIAQSRGVQLKEYVIGSYVVAILVNAKNPVSDLSSNQVFQLFSGAVHNWKDVGGPDAPVQLYVRDPVSGTHLGFKELAMANQAYASGEKLLPSYKAIADAVAQDPNGIGYCGFDQLKHPDVKVTTIGGVAPSVETVNAKKYPYARTLRFYTNGGAESASAKDFVNFTLSEDGQKILAQLGFATKP